MALLATQEVGLAGLASPTYAAAASGGDSFTPDSLTFLHIKNASGGNITVTVVTPRAGIGGLAITDATVVVPLTTGASFIGPFPAEHFAYPTSGVGSITYSGVTSLTIAVLKLAQPSVG